MVADRADTKGGVPRIGMAGLQRRSQLPPAQPGHHNVSQQRIDSPRVPARAAQGLVGIERTARPITAHDAHVSPTVTCHGSPEKPLVWLQRFIGEECDRLSDEFLTRDSEHLLHTIVGIHDDPANNASAVIEEAALRTTAKQRGDRR